MQLHIKPFHELTLTELHDIYQARVAVFVVEQECPYQEVDGHDPVSYHLWFDDDKGIQAYLRVLPPGTTFPEASIGRVISLKRHQGLATRLLHEAICLVEKLYGTRRITIEAQVYARSLYEQLGFVQVSEEFLEDGIPHIRMTLNKDS